MNIKRLFAGDTENTAVQFLRYCFVGGLAFVVDYGVMVLLVEVFGLYAVLASALSFVLGLSVNYILSTYWIFKKSRFSNRFIEFAGFAVIGVIGLGINTIILWFFQDYLAAIGAIPILPQDKYYAAGKIVSTAVVFVWNFFARKFMLFK
ncbi:MAG TPA: GtrA family protein [Ruminococcaceae bacterium]|nr:GtrA family protein [Oscillospiraceae bacterium]